MTTHPAITNADTATHRDGIAAFEICGQLESMGYEFRASLCVTPCQFGYEALPNLISRAS